MKCALLALAACGAPPLAPLPPMPADAVHRAATLGVGETFGCLRTTDDVRCWGYHVPGLPLEPGHRATPERIPELDGARAIAVGRDAVCALAGDVRCSVMRSVPNGTYDVHGMPFHDEQPAVDRIPGDDVVQVAVGAGQACALRHDGTVHCWGAAATPAPRVDHVVEIAVGGADACARLTDGSVRCWRAGNLVMVPGIERAVELAIGFGFGCARIADGTVRCWGGNNSGQLGDGTRETRTTAAPVRGLSDAIAIAAGDNHACAIVPGGELRCWGDNTYGELGPRSPADVARDADGFHWIERLAPAPVVDMPLVGEVALGSYVTCTRNTDGVRCVGRNDLGQAPASIAP